MRSGARFFAEALVAALSSSAIQAEGPAKHKEETAATRAAITKYAQLRVAGKSYLSHELFDQPDRIEHNPDIADGLGGDKKFLEEREKAHPEKFGPTAQYVNVIDAILADGDFAAIKSHVYAKPGDPGREFVDIWRLRDGKFAEHWDVIQPIEPAVSKDTQVACGVGTTYAEAKAVAEATVENPACGKPDHTANSEANRKVVLDYMKLGRQPGKFTESVNRYISPDFIQHSASIPPGRQGLIDMFAPHMASLVAGGRNARLGHVIADGDFVLVHRRITTAKDPRGTAIVDLYRLRNGKIAEHWDVRQPIPEYSVAGHGMVELPLEPGRHKGPPPSP